MEIKNSIYLNQVWCKKLRQNTQGNAHKQVNNLTSSTGRIGLLDRDSGCSEDHGYNTV